jgi:hypothetical protein
MEMAVAPVQEIASTPDESALKHDPEKWEPIFGKDHAQSRS